MGPNNPRDQTKELVLQKARKWEETGVDHILYAQLPRIQYEPTPSRSDAESHAHNEGSAAPTNDVVVNFHRHQNTASLNKRDCAGGSAALSELVSEADVGRPGGERATKQQPVGVLKKGVRT